MKPFDTITFNASRSYDINDDFNSNKNIDDGVPPGELAMDDETDTLQYKWYFGDGTNTAWINTPMANHKYQMDASVKEKNYTVTLQVRNRAFHVVSDTCWIRIFNEEHPPRITGMEIKPQSVDPYFGTFGPRAVVNQEVQFVGYAEDRDPWDFNDLRYEWEFKDSSGSTLASKEGQTVTNKFSLEDTYTIRLWVYDGEKGNKSTFSVYQDKELYISKNMEPQTKILAARFEQKPVEHRITAQYNEEITFNSSLSYDIDNLPGFDTNGDFMQDYNLSFRWHWNWDRQNLTEYQGLDPSLNEEIISAWTFNRTIVHEFTPDDYMPGTQYQVKVYMEVDDGEVTVRSGVFVVTLNLRPNAGFYINNHSEVMALDPVGIGEHIFLDAGLSYDPNDDLNGDGVIISPEVDQLTYSWSFDDGTSATGRTAKHAFAEVGDHIIILTVSDGELSTTKSRHVIVQDLGTPPIIVMEITPSSGPTNFPFSFKSSDSYDNDRNDDVVKFFWDFGDGATSDLPDTSHKYAKEGLYRITLKITDRKSLVSENKNHSLVVYNRDPYVVLNLNPKGLVETLIKMSATATDPDGEIMGYLWDFGDDNFLPWSNQSNPTHEYKNTGTYTITVTVKDDKGKTNISGGVIKIDNPPVVVPPGEAEAVAADILFWIIVVIVVAVIVVAIVAIVWRIQREAL
jgi:PKD repeat protein